MFLDYTEPVLSEVEGLHPGYERGALPHHTVDRVFNRSHPALPPVITLSDSQDHKYSANYIT